MTIASFSLSRSTWEQSPQPRRPKLGGASRALSEQDQAALQAILDGPRDFVPHPSFEGPDAQRRLFDELPPVPRPDTSWYCPVEYLSGPGVRLNAIVPLTPEQEQALFLQYNYCRFMVGKLCTQVAPGPIGTGLARQVLAWHAKAQAYQDQIVQSNLGLVLAMLKRRRPGQGDFADLISEGNMALMRAVAKFDAARGFKFSTYACRAIIKAHWHSSEKLHRYRGFFTTEFNLALERSDFTETQRQRHDDDCADEVRQIVRENRAALTDLEQKVIAHRFVMGIGDGQPPQPGAARLTLEQIGRLVGLTRERVRQVQNQALAKLRRTLEADFLD